LEKRYIDGFQSAITGEVCSLTDFIEGIVAHERDRKDIISILPIDSNANPSRPLIFNIKSLQLAPRGWLRQNQSAAVALGHSLHHDISAVADALTSPPSQIRDTTTRLHPTNWLAQIHLNEANRTILNCTKDFLAHRSMLRSTIALERHRLAHGAYPAALDQITSFMDERPPYDPFSAKSLQYTNVKGTPRLWSLGRNYTDEGGIPPEKKKSTAGQITSLVNDIVWILPGK
jgi:hypothetical protein